MSPSMLGVVVQSASTSMFTAVCARANEANVDDVLHTRIRRTVKRNRYIEVRSNNIRVSFAGRPSFRIAVNALVEAKS
jgi:hypothetical protein